MIHHFLTYSISWKANNNYKDKIFVSYSNKKNIFDQFFELWL
jgi:hypothetical protein